MMQLRDREWCIGKTGNGVVGRQGMMIWGDREWCSCESGNYVLARQGMVYWEIRNGIVGR